MLEFMKRIGIFIICAQSLLHFCAGKGYEKYVKLLIGMMILGQFVVPVRALLLGEGEAELWEKIDMFQVEMNSIASDIELPEFEENNLTDSVNEEIKSKLYNSAYEAGFFIQDIKMSTKENEERLTVVLGTEENANPPIQIEAISVSISKEDGKKDRDDKKSNTITELQSEFGRLLGIDGAYIEILLEE